MNTALWMHGAGQMLLAAPERGARVNEALGMGMMALTALALLALLLAVKAAFVAAALWYRLRCPGAAERMYCLLQTKRSKCFWLGLANLVCGVVLALLLISTEVLGLFGLALLAFLAGCIVVGYGLAYRELGARIAPDEDGLTPMLLGGVLAETLYLLPLFGQLLSLGALVRGLGAVTLSIWLRREPIAWPEEAAPPKPAEEEQA